MDIEEQYDKLYRYCYMHTHHRQTAEDITQETFLRFFESPSYKDKGKKLAYLYTIAKNLCIDFYRKKKEQPVPEEELFSNDVEIHQNSAGNNQEDIIVQTHILKEAVEILDAESQEIIFLRYVNELTVVDIGKILGISRFAVHRRIKLCLSQLKDKLGKEGFF